MMKQVDTILNCRWIIPIEPHGVVHEHYAVVIHQGKIVDLLPQDQVATLYRSDHVSDRNHHAVLPGFVNSHTHSPMVLFRGLADDLPLMDWLTNHIWPAEAKWLSPEFIQDGTELAVAEMIKSGTTCFNEHFFYPEVIAEVARTAKIRACIGATIINFPTNWSKDENDGFEKFQQLIPQLKSDPLLTLSLAPHAPYTTTDQILIKIKEFSENHHLTIHMHVHETEQEVLDSIAQYGKRPMQRLHDLGLLSPRFQCVHMTQLNDEDLSILTATKANVSHCPESNLKLASGYCPVDTLLKLNINVALGTDGAASNNNLDMMGEMRTAAFIGKTVANSATAVSATDVLRMATLNGAKAMGLDHVIGSIEPDKSADLIAIDLDELCTLPTYHAISQIVYSAMSSQITDAWVAGKQLLENKQLLTLDENRIRQTAKKWLQRLR
jgi:5-methylthioadenosine/S-adenosylhomocysteine deaminase